MAETCDTEEYYAKHHEWIHTHSYYELPFIPENSTTIPIAHFKIAQNEIREPAPAKQSYACNENNYEKVIYSRMKSVAIDAARKYNLDQKALFRRMCEIKVMYPKMTQKIIASGTLILALHDYNIDVKICTLCDICGISAPTARKARRRYSCI